TRQSLNQVEQHHLRTGALHAGHDERDPHQELSMTTLVERLGFSTENSCMILLRKASPASRRGNLATATMAAAMSAGLLSATMHRGSLRIVAASPTRVATHGVPQAIASARTFGNPSPVDVMARTSSALYAPTILLCAPRQMTRAAPIRSAA